VVEAEEVWVEVVVVGVVAVAVFEGALVEVVVGFEGALVEVVVGFVPPVFVEVEVPFTVSHESRMVLVPFDENGVAFAPRLLPTNAHLLLANRWAEGWLLVLVLCFLIWIPNSLKMIALRSFKMLALSTKPSFIIIVMEHLKGLRRFILLTKMMPFEQLMNMTRLRLMVELCL
jgi:hypothetical protein